VLRQAQHERVLPCTPAEPVRPERSVSEVEGGTAVYTTAYMKSEVILLDLGHRLIWMSGVGNETLVLAINEQIQLFQYGLANQYFIT
jgi:hypothetical protein